MMGGRASATSGISQAQDAPPDRMKASTSRPRVGSERQMLARLIRIWPPLLVCPMMTPSGSEMTAAITMASAVYSIVSMNRAGTPLDPLQWPDTVSHCQAKLKKLMASHPSRVAERRGPAAELPQLRRAGSPLPGREQPPDEHQDHVRDQRQQDDQHEDRKSTR